MDEQILNAFKRLPTSTQRLAVTSQIVECLTVEEMCGLRDIINRRNDPLARLPIEMVTCIFSYLDLFDAWRLQAVCRQWRSILGSKDLQSLVLSGWDTHDTRNNKAFNAPKGIGKSVESKIKHIRAFRLGAPVTALNFEEDLNSDAGCRGGGLSRLPCVALNGHRLAYIQHEREVAVRDLSTGSVKVLRGHAREKLTCLVLTHSHIAFFGFNGQLYIFNLEHLDRPSVYRLPSSRVLSIAGDADMVAISLATSTEDPNSTAAVFAIVYCKADQQQSRLVTIGPASAEHALTAHGTSLDALLLSKERESLDVFGIMRRVESRHSVPEQLIHFRISLSDQNSTQDMRYRSEAVIWDSNPTTGCISNGEVLLTRRKVASRFEITDILPTGYRNLYQIIRPNYSDIEFFTSIMFDAQTSQLWTEYHWPESTAMHSPSDNFAPYEYFRWKDMIFFESIEREAPDLIVSRLVGPRALDSTFTDGFDPFGKHLKFKAQNMLKHCGYAYKMLVNDSFLVVLERGRHDLMSVTVLCFDEDIKMPGAKDTGFWKEGKFVGGPSCKAKERPLSDFHHKCLDLDAWGLKVPCDPEEEMYWISL